MFYGDLVDNIQTTLYRKFTQIKEKDDEMKESMEKLNIYAKDHNLTEEQKNMLLDGRKKVALLCPLHLFIAK